MLPTVGRFGVPWTVVSALHAKGDVIPARKNEPERTALESRLGDVDRDEEAASAHWYVHVEPGDFPAAAGEPEISETRVVGRRELSIAIVHPEFECGDVTRLRRPLEPEIEPLGRLLASEPVGSRTPNT